MRESEKRPEKGQENFDSTSLFLLKYNTEKPLKYRLSLKKYAFFFIGTRQWAVNDLYFIYNGSGLPLSSSKTVINNTMLYTDENIL